MDPNNYHGMSLVSCFGNLFTSSINQQLLSWSTNNDIITDGQFGFKPVWQS